MVILGSIFDICKQRRQPPILPSILLRLIWLLGVAVASGVRFFQAQKLPPAEMTIVPVAGSTSVVAPSHTETTGPISGPAIGPTPTALNKPMEIVIHVAGAVKKPGVYHFKEDARTEDAIKAAGGAKTDANLDAVNLASHLIDGSQLYLPTRTEVPEGGAPKSADIGKGSSVAKAGTSKGHLASSSSKGNKLSSPSEGKINVNTAGLEQLQRLPGVGPAMSERIIQYRKENGPFTSADQLTEVSGIGPKKYEKMQPFVRIR